MAQNFEVFPVRYISNCRTYLSHSLLTFYHIHSLSTSSPHRLYPQLGIIQQKKGQIELSKFPFSL
jgi:hypothetical protein